MKSSIVTLSIISALAISGCSSTDDSTVASADTNKKKVDLVCEYYRPTGSNLKKKVCMTRAQRTAMREQSKDEMNKVHRRLAHESAVTSQ